MKIFQATKQTLLLLVIAIFAFSSCKKDSDPVTPQQQDVLPVPIASLVSQTMIDSLRAAGATIYSGTTPNIVNGIYFMHPDSCIYDNNNAANIGVLFADYKFKLTNQSNTAFTVDVAQKNVSSGVENNPPVYSYISGDGNNFSIFILRTLTPSGVTVQQFNVLSGTLTANGVQNFQNTLYMRSKVGDADNTLVVAAGTIRVFVTGAPGLAANSATY